MDRHETLRADRDPVTMTREMHDAMRAEHSATGRHHATAASSLVAGSDCHDLETAAAPVGVHARRNSASITEAGDMRCGCTDGGCGSCCIDSTPSSAGEPATTSVNVRDGSNVVAVSRAVQAQGQFAAAPLSTGLDLPPPSAPHHILHAALLI